MRRCTDNFTPLSIFIIFEFEQFPRQITILWTYGIKSLNQRRKPAQCFRNISIYFVVILISSNIF